MQAQFICLSVNLPQLIEHGLGKEGIVNEPEVKRRAARMEAAQKQAGGAKHPAAEDARDDAADDAAQRQTHPLGSSPSLAGCPLESRLRSPAGALRQIIGRCFGHRCFAYRGTDTLNRHFESNPSQPFEVVRVALIVRCRVHGATSHHLQRPRLDPASLQ